MNPGSLVLLGTIAGVTIFLGMPIGRLRSVSRRLRSVLSALTIGVLLFLLWDVLSHAVEPVEGALEKATSGHPGSWAPFLGLAALFFGAIAIGLLGLVAYDRFMHARSDNPKLDEDGAPRMGVLRLSEHASRVAFLVAVGIGLHNFSEGLAIGQSAASGKISLALVLVVGFALHNATEGFGITAPLAGNENRPSWGQLAVLGVIGGAPTVIGTLLGSVYVNEALSLTFLSLAAGSILYVVVQLLSMVFKSGHTRAVYAGILIGLIAGFVTDFVVTASGV